MYGWDILLYCVYVWLGHIARVCVCMDGTYTIGSFVIYCIIYTAMPRIVTNEI